MSDDILESWGISPSQLTAILREHPRARAMLGGYIAREKVKEFLASNPDVEKISEVKSAKKGPGGKAELVQVQYRGENILLRVVSLDAPGKENHRTSRYVFQCKGSDTRKVRLDNGTTMQTTESPLGEYEIVAVSLFEVDQRWRFAYCRTQDLETNPDTGLLKMSQRISLPLRDRYVGDAFSLFERICRQRKSKSSKDHRK
jgi:hypothetical protein